MHMAATNERHKMAQWIGFDKKAFIAVTLFLGVA